MKRRFTLILAPLILAQAVACGQSGSSDDTTEPDNTDSTPAETTEKFVYEYPKTFGGYDFNILNAGDIYNMRAELDREESTGEPLDDAMYDRCRLVEEKLEITITETTKGVDSELANFAQKAIMSGEDEYDFMYIPARDLYKFTSQGQLNNLLTIEGFNLDKEWWSQSYNDASTIGGELFAAVGASQLMYIDSLWSLFFNEDMINDLGLDMPYDLVREGKWTIEELGKYVKAGARLNGDDSFDWNENGKSIYGLSGGSVYRFLTASEEYFVDSKDGKLVLDVGDAHFYDVADALGKVLTQNNGYLFGSIDGKADGQPGNYITTFETQRALFLTAELSKTSRMRDKDFAFGVVPYPKYDLSQENYHSIPFYGTPGLTIPITVEDPERSAIVADALAYHGNEMVLPIFREVTLEQKGLRNDDSIEMLDIIIKASRPDLCYIYNVGLDMRSAVSTAIYNGEATASIIAEHESKVKTELEKLNG